MKHSHLKNITLKHLLINDIKMIGLLFYPDKVIQALVKELPNPKWHTKLNMVYIKNTKGNLKLIFEKFKGIAWIDTSYFFKNKPLHNNPNNNDASLFKRRVYPTNYKKCPDSYIQKLILKKYALNTVNAYVSAFEAFINHYKSKELNTLNEIDIRDYIQLLIKQGRSNSAINICINSIKFYYEIVLDMPNRFYEIERPRKQEKLPEILSKKEVIAIINNTNNLKHRCIVSLLYSAGLRRSELLNLKLTDINSERMLIHVKQSKGNKDRYTLLSKKVLLELREYFKLYKPQIYLFEGKKGIAYSAASVVKIVKRAAKKASIYKKVTPHMLRHSFATHILESGTDIRYIQELLGHSSTKTTEIYTRVATNNLQSIKNPLD